MMDPDFTARAETSRRELGDWLERHGWAGNDPYQLDVVFSRLGDKPLLGQALGFVRRCLKPYHAMIPPRLMTAAKPILVPQALGYALSGEALAGDLQQARRRATAIFSLLGQTRSPLASELAWGLPFVWGGHEKHPPHWPTSVTTAIVMHGLLDAEKLLGEKAVSASLESCTRFLLQECGYEETARGPVLRFGPGDARPILNASAVGAAALARYGATRGRGDVLDFAEQAALAVSRWQHSDGSWDYAPSHGPHSRDSIIDSRHTGYILEALALIDVHRPNPLVRSAVTAGWQYVRTNLLDGPFPRWSPQETWPVDSHDVAQLIVTATVLGHHDIAAAAVKLALDRFYAGNGAFRYKLLADGRTNDAVFIRWTQAPMYRAFSLFLHVMRDQAKLGPTSA